MQTVPYTDGDFDRIGTIKKGADSVYQYVQWVIEDHARVLVHQKHVERIEALVEEITAIFGLLPHRKELAYYFIANVVKAAREVEEEQVCIKDWTSLSDDAISEMYDASKIEFIMPELSLHNRAMYAGVFISETTETHDKLDAITKGQVIGCDPWFIQTAHWQTLLELQEADSFELGDIGRALVALAPMAFSKVTLGDLMSAFRSEDGSC